MYFTIHRDTLTPLGYRTNSEPYLIVFGDAHRVKLSPHLNHREKRKQDGRRKWVLSLPKSSSFLPWQSEWTNAGRKRGLERHQGPSEKTKVWLRPRSAALRGEVSVKAERGHYRCPAALLPPPLFFTLQTFEHNVQRHCEKMKNNSELPLLFFIFLILSFNSTDKWGLDIIVSFILALLLPLCLVCPEGSVKVCVAESLCLHVCGFQCMSAVLCVCVFVC